MNNLCQQEARAFNATPVLGDEGQYTPTFGYTVTQWGLNPGDAENLSRAGFLNATIFYAKNAKVNRAVMAGILHSLMSHFSFHIADRSKMLDAIQHALNEHFAA